MRFAIVSCLVGLAGCSSSTKIVHVSAKGSTSGLVRAGDHVAYLLNIKPGAGGTGELHVTSSTGSDVVVAPNIAAGGYLFTPDGSALLFTQINPGGNDASLQVYNVAQGGSPKVAFANGLHVTPNDPTVMNGPNHTAPLAQQGGLTPSGKFFFCGVAQPNVAISSDLHVVDTASGADVFQRANGAFDYGEFALPDDTLVFTDAPGGNDGVTGPVPLEGLFWVKLPGTTAAKIDDRVALFTSSPDAKYIVYQKTDRTLWLWDATARTAATKQLATDTVQFAVASQGVAYTNSDGSLHIIGFDASKKLDLPASSASRFTTLPLSPDGTDVYFFAKVETLGARGTLMHVAASGGTPAKIDDNVSLYDVRPVPGGLLYLRNVDSMGLAGELVKAGRDGAGGVSLGSGVPVGVDALAVQGSGNTWLSAHLLSAVPSPTETLVDGSSTVKGTLALTTAGSNTKVEPNTRLGDYTLSDDLETLVYLGDIKVIDATANNYPGTLKWLPVGMPSMMPQTIGLESTTEITPVIKRSFFANSIGLASPGVSYITY